LAAFFTNFPLDGILGLAFPKIAGIGDTPVFHNLVKQKLVDEPIFTVWLKKDGSNVVNKYGGQITYGAFDDEHCQPGISWIPLTHEWWWIFDIEGTGSNGAKYVKKYSAITDTGTSFIIGPSAPLNKLVKATKAVFHEEYGLYEVNCNTKFTWSIYANGKEFAITQDNLAWNYGGECLLAYAADDWMETPNFVLGDPWVRSFCQVHDIENDQVGFAVPKPV